MDDAKATLGARLKQLINQRGLNQAELAQRAGLTEDTVSTYVRGRAEPPFDTLFRLCRVLEVTPNDLFGYPEAGEEADAETAARLADLREAARRLDPRGQAFLVDIAWRAVRHLNSFD